MAAITGSVASGFPTAAAVASTAAAASTVSAATATSTAATTTNATRYDTRLSGVGLHLGAPAQRSAATHSDLFATLRSALDGFDAQTGFDQLLVRRLIAT